MKFITRASAGPLPVYDIGVPHKHNYVLSNGLVSHNCFNKSHSIAYSKVTYICAWLKANYPEEFFCSLMTTRSRSLQPKDWAIKAPIFITEAKQLGVDIYPPTVNASDVGFTIRDGNVYFGLNAIKGIGLGAARSIIRTRGKKPFKNIEDFISRINLSKVNTGVFQSLVKSGAFDRMGYRREDLLKHTNDLYNWIKDLQQHHERVMLNKQREIENESLRELIDKRNELRRIDRLKSTRDLTQEEREFLQETKGLRLNRMLKVDQEPPEIPSIPQYRQVSLSIMELMEQAEYIGCFIGTHPASIIYPDSTPIALAEENEKQTLAGVVSNVKKIIDRNNNEMAFMAFGDGTGIAEAVIFASVYKRLKAKDLLPEPGDLIEAFGMVDQVDPDVNMKLFAVQKYRSDT